MHMLEKKDVVGPSEGGGSSRPVLLHEEETGEMWGRPSQTGP